MSLGVLVYIEGAYTATAYLPSPVVQISPVHGPVSISGATSVTRLVHLNALLSRATMTWYPAESPVAVTSSSLVDAQAAPSAVAGWENAPCFVGCGRAAADATTGTVSGLSSATPSSA